MRTDAESIHTILFEVLVEIKDGAIWLGWHDVEDIAAKLNILVPPVG